jgi:hypothetical protein
MRDLCGYTFPGTNGIPCLAAAVRGRYCASHYLVVHGAKPTRPSARKKDVDRDLLPFTPDEFQGLAALKEKTRG